MGFRLTGNATMEKGLFEPDVSELWKEFLRKWMLLSMLERMLVIYCCLA